MLQNNEYEIAGLILGNDRDSEIFVEDVKIGSVDWNIQDSDNPVGDTRFFGRDFIRPESWTFQLVINAKNATEARKLFSRLSKIWKNREIAKTPGALSVLRYRVDNETRKIYGRPRNFAPDDLSGLDQGVITCSAEFRRADTISYLDEDESVSITLVPRDAGGLTGELSGNLTSLASGERAGLIHVNGDADVPVQVVFHGPITNPSARVGDWVVGLTGELAYDVEVTVDSRTNTVTRQDGANLSGRLSRLTYLEDVRLGPGDHEVIFNGIDNTGTATCTVIWSSGLEGF